MIVAIEVSMVVNGSFDLVLVRGIVGREEERNVCCIVRYVVVTLIDESFFVETEGVNGGVKDE